MFTGSSGFCHRAAGLRAALAAGVVCTIWAATAHGAGKYVLAYMYEVGFYENHNPVGNHSAYIHVWDENGNPKSGVQLTMPDSTLMGTTDTFGYVEVAIYEGGAYFFKCKDGAGSASDTSFEMNTHRPPAWGHYSYELGFMFKSDAANPGNFDLTVECPPFKTDNQPPDNDPRTASMTYYGVSCAWQSDAYDLTPSCSTYHQTFVANANRIVAAKIQGTAGGGVHIWWSAQILQGGPGGPPVGPVRTTREIVSDEYFPVLVKWPVSGPNSVPVVPGQTYCLKVFRSNAAGAPSGGMVTYQANNNYADGTFFCGNNSDAGHDIQGVVVALQYADGTVAGVVKDTGGTPIQGATITIKPGNYTTQSKADGTYSIASIVAGTYTVSAAASGHATHNEPNVAVTTGQTSTVNFNLSSSFGTLSGTVRNAANNATISGAAVTTSTGGYSAASDGSGSYSITNVETGAYSVSASKDGYGSQTLAATVNNGATATTNFLLPPNTIAGQVRDGDGNPIAQATVTANPGNLSTQTVADGSYAFTAVPPATYTVSAGKAGFSTATNPSVVVGVGQTATADFTLIPVGTNLAPAAVTYLECGHTNTSEIGLNAHDGNDAAGKWACKHNGNNQPGDHSLAYDLGSNAKVAQFVLKNVSLLGEPAGAVGTWDTKGLVFESGPSLRGPWTQEFAITNNTQPTIAFAYPAAKTLRYVRLRVTQPTQDNSNWAVRVPEFEVWGFAGDAEPIRFEAEDYDSGANAVEGTDFHDTTAGNSGGQYRNQNVDIETCSEGGWDVPMDAGEWLKYRLKGGGKWALSVRHSGAAASACHLDIDGINVSGALNLPATGGTQTWQTFNGPTFTIGGDDHLLHLVNDAGSHSINYFTLSAPPATAPGDFDHDGDVDQEDFGHLQHCLTGLGYPQNDPACADAKLDVDNDVDQDDYNVFRACMSGAGIPASIDCAG